MKEVHAGFILAMMWACVGAHDGEDGWIVYLYISIRQVKGNAMQLAIKMDFTQSITLETF